MLPTIVPGYAPINVTTLGAGANAGKGIFAGINTLLFTLDTHLRY